MHQTGELENSRRPPEGVIAHHAWLHYTECAMDHLDQKIDALESKIDELQRSVDTVKKIFLWTLIVSVVVFVLPLLGLLLVIPQFLSTYSGALQ